MLFDFSLGRTDTSMTIFLPLGGADLSGVVIVILVGAALYGASCCCAFWTPAEPEELLLELEFEELLELELEELLSEPQAATASASATVAMTAVRPLACRRPRFRPAGSV
jgi:hypothetical protein